MSANAKELLRQAADRELVEFMPDQVTCSIEERVEYEQRVRDYMARELKSVRKPVKRHVTRDGIDLTYMTAAGVVELRKYAWHKAFKRQLVCEKCVRDAKESKTKAPLVCSCPTEYQRWLRKLVRQLDRNPWQHTWKLLYVLLIVRDEVQHYYQNYVELVDAKLSARDRSPSQRDAELIDIYDKVPTRDDDDEIVGEEDRLVETVSVEVSDGTSRLNYDLRGWDKPTSIGRRTQRYAFCPTCKELGDPWFLTALTTPKYTAECTRCKTVETEPDASPRTPVYIVKRTRKAHRQILPVYFTFFRSRGRWVRTDTMEVCHTQLGNAIQKLWRSRK